MTTDADERPTDETAVEAEVAETPPEVAEAPAEVVAETPAEAVADTPTQAVAETPTQAVAETPTQAVAETPTQVVAETPAEAAADDAGEPVQATVAAEATPKDAAEPAAKKPRRRKPRERRKPAPEMPRSRAPLPIDQLRDASRSTMNLFGARQALRDALAVLAPRERQELNLLIAADDDHRPRARNIANGSIGAGRIDKAMAATIVSMAPQEELWTALLDKEQAAQKLGRIREAKQRDKQRADRAAERANRTDRVSREDMAKATDGRVGATIRFVTDDKRDRRDKDAPKKPSGGGSVLDRLGY